MKHAVAWTAGLSIALLLLSQAWAGTPPCRLLDDPMTRVLMSSAFEYRLMKACGREIPVVMSEWSDNFGRPTRGPKGPNVQVNNSAEDNPADATVQSECSIAVRPSDGALVAGFNDAWHYYHYSGSSAQAFAGFSNSTDTGASWTDHGPFNGAPVGLSVGDPDMNVDNDGNFFFSTLWSDGGFDGGVFIAKSTDGGATFGSTVDAHHGSGDDKVLTAIDRSGGTYDGYIYLCWTDFNQSPFNLYCAHSTNGGTSFSGEVKICTTCGSESGQAAMPAVGPDGTVYVAWQSFTSFPPSQARIKISKSTNGGASFTAVTNPTPLFAPSQDASASSSCGRPALKGPFRYEDFPIMAVSPDGTVHLVWSQHGAGADEADAMYAKSEDGGATWSAPFKLNDDSTTSDQFWPSIMSNPHGVLHAYWYDRREDSNNINYKIYETRSLDNGDTWAANTAVSDVASPIYASSPYTATCYMGDYNKGTSDENSVYLIWSDQRNTQGGHPDPDVWMQTLDVCDNSAFAVSITPPGGQFPPSEQPVNVTLNITGDDPLCPEPGPVYYTLDGTDPTTSSPAYDEPIPLTTSATVKILPVTCCGQQKPIQSEDYVLCTNTDPLHCGEQCLVCGADETCEGGQCVPLADDDSDDDADDDSDDDADDDAGDDDSGGGHKGCGC